MEPKSWQLVFITLLDRFTWPTTGSYQAVKSSRCTQEPNGTKQCHRQSASLRAPEESWQPTILAPSTFVLSLPSLKQVSLLNTGRNPIHRHNTPSTTLKIHEKWLGPLDEGSTSGHHSNPVSHRPVVTKRKYSKCFKRKVNFGWIHLQLLRSGIAHISWYLPSVAVYHCSQCGGCVD